MGIFGPGSYDSPYYYGSGGYRPHRFGVRSSVGSNNSPYYYGSGGRKPAGVSKVPVATPQPKASPYPSWLSAMSDSQIAALAEQQVQAQLAALRDPIMAARQRAAQLALAQRQEIVALGGALAQMEGGIAPSISAAWGTGADAIRDIGGAIGDSLAENVGGSQAANDAYVAEHAPGSGPSGQAPNAAAEGGVVTGLAGTIPGESFDTQGQALEDFYNKMPGVEAANVREDYMAALAQARADDADYEQQLIDVAKQYPQLRSQAIDALYQHELDKLNARMGIDKQKADAKQQAFENNLATQDMMLKQRAEAANELALGIKASQPTKLQIVRNADGSTVAVDPTTGKVVQRISGPKQQPPKTFKGPGGYMYRMNGDGTATKIAGQTPAPGKSGTTAMQKATKDAVGLRGNPVEYKGDAVVIVPGVDTPYHVRGKYVADMRKAKAKHRKVFSVPNGKGGYIQTTNDPKLAATDATMSFVQAQSYLMQTYGLNRAQARKALIAAGWMPDGKRP